MSIAYNILINTNNNDNYDKLIKIVNKITVMMMMIMIMIGSALYSTYIILYPHIGGDISDIPHHISPWISTWMEGFKVTSCADLRKANWAAAAACGAERSRDVFFGAWKYVGSTPIFQCFRGEFKPCMAANRPILKSCFVPWSGRVWFWCEGAGAENTAGSAV